MDKLTGKHIQVLSRAYKAAKPLVKLTDLWCFLNMEYGIGCIDKNKLILGHTDYQQIRELIITEMGIDLSEPLPTGSRIDIARETGNEKLNAQAPGRHHILLNSHSGQLLINRKMVPLMERASYRLDWRMLTEFPQSIIVVENLQAFDNFQTLNLPQILSTAVVVYRGHNISSKAVIDFLNAAPNSTQIVAFCDYDPKGFEIALTTTKVTHILLPQLEQAFTGTEGTRSRFDKQHDAITHFSNKPFPRNLNAHWEEMMNKKRCVSQENVLAYSKVLEIFEL